MKFSKMKLMNLPLENNYQNVIDIVDFHYHKTGEFSIKTKEEFNIKLYNTYSSLAKFQSPQIELNNTKGINLSSIKSFVITNSVNEIITTDYNYIILFNDDYTEMLFGFINEFSNIGNSIYTFNCSYDVWSNNLYLIYQNQDIITYEKLTNTPNYNLIASMNKGHIINTFKENNDDNVVHYITYPYTEYEPNFKILSNITFREQVLWLKVVLSESVANNPPTNVNIGSLPTLYFPIAYRRNVNEFFPLVKNLKIINNYFTPNNLPSLSRVIDGLKIISDKIISAKLTYNCPIKYTVEVININEKLAYNIVLHENASFTDITIGEEDTINYVTSSITGNALRIEETYQTSIKGIDNENDYLIFNKSRIKFNDAIFQDFPFNYKVFKCADFTKIITGLNFYTEIEFEFDYRTDCLGIKINKYNAKTKEWQSDFIDYIKIEDERSVSFSRDSLQYYLSSQGAQAKSSRALTNTRNILNNFTSLLNSAIDGITALVTGGEAGGATIKSSINSNIESNFGIIQNEIMYKSKLEDAETTADVAMYSNNRGEVEYNFSDCFSILQYTFDKNSIENLEIDDDIYFNGYKISKKINPFSVSKILFDYLQVENININIGLDTFDRNTIYSIFKKGVRKHHLIINSLGNKFEDNLLLLKNGDTTKENFDIQYLANKEEN